MTVPSWRLPLGALPEIAVIAIGTHHAGEPGRWRLPDRWCLHFYQYHAGLVVGGHPLRVAPGTVGLIPPDADMQYAFEGTSQHSYAHFTVPPGGPVVEVRALQDLGRGFAARLAAFNEAIGWHATQPRRAEARLYDLLWGLVGAEPAAGQHPALERARHVIELRLAEPLAVDAIARAAGCSPPHLLRLFRSGLGTTVVGYIRARRVARAASLLQASTLPMALIAREVGLGDLHAFNKAVKRELGLSPRAVRAGGR